MGEQLDGSSLPLVDAVDIIRLVGPRPFGRAKEYVRDGRVVDTTWDAEARSLTATVTGSDAEPYRCDIELRPTRGDYSRPGDTGCTCPLGGSCKHVAAALLQNNQAALAERTASAGSAAGAAAPDQGTDGSDGAARADAGHAVPDWKSSLGALGRPASGAVGGPSARTTRLGLQFELREQTRTARSRWEAPAATALTAITSTPGRSRLAVRPVTQSASGNWVRSNVSWSSLPYSMNRLAITAEQHGWFQQFTALHKSAVAAYSPGEADWLYLDDFASPLLWPLLAEADRLGIALVTGKRETDVTVAAEATITVDVIRDGDPTAGAGAPAGLRVTTTARITGSAPPDAPLVDSGSSLGVIADHGVYRVRFAPGLQVTLAPTAAPVTDEQRRLLLRHDAIVVPPGDADEFFAEYYPTLHEAVSVISSDDSVVFPEIEPPRLLLTATFGSRHRLTLAWRWLIAGRRHPVGHRAPLPDLSAVTDLVPGDAPVGLSGIEAAEFASKTIPALQQHPDVRVEIVGERPDYYELTDTPKLTVTTVETDKRDWFDLGVLVTVEGRTVPFAPLLKALATRQRKLLLVDHSYLSLAHPAFDELKRLIDEASSLDEWETGPRINRFQASLWSEFDDLADETVQAESWARSVGGLLELEHVDTAATTPVPAGVQATLRPYQHEGFAWLSFLYRHQLGGILADDMGLGKTLQTLALIAHVRETEAAHEGGDGAAKPFLVVAPTSVVSNWVAEAERFTPGLVARGLTATESKGRGMLREAAAGADIVVTSYALFRLDAAAYRAESWAGLILDEAQFVKNPASQAHRCAAELDAPFKLAITGTPMENSLTDLWALFHIVAPGLLSTRLRFTDDYVKPIAAGTGPAASGEGAPGGAGWAGAGPAAAKPAAERLARLRKRVRPLMMRRTKDMVAADLPAKQEQVLRVDLEPSHRLVYDRVLQRERQKLLGLIDDLDRHQMIVFRSLTLLRMLSLDASLVDAEAYADVPSAKLDQLLDEIDDVVAEGHRALVFSQFTSFLGKVADRLTERQVAFEYLDGSTRRRADVISRFKQGDAPAFLISLKAGGFGLNLTEADYVFILDPWWNPAAESQAVDRTHRIGQTKNVMIYRMIANDTIEEKVLALKEQKAQLFDAVMDDDAVFSSTLTADDIRALLD